MEARPSPDQILREEFNRWAEAGRGEEMERHHLDITEKTIRLMDLRAGERVLDLGCGAGWATRLLARMVGEHDRPQSSAQSPPNLKSSNEIEPDGFCNATGGTPVGGGADRCRSKVCSGRVP